MAPPLACCNSTSHTVEPTADNWPLAALACCRHSWAAPKRYCTASPFPPSVPIPCCCCSCCSCCSGPFDLRAYSSFARAELVPLHLRRLRGVPGPLGILLGILQLPPQLQNLPLSHHCSLLPLGMGLLQLQPNRHLGSGGEGGDTGERRARPLGLAGPPLSP